MPREAQLPTESTSRQGGPIHHNPVQKSSLNLRILSTPNITPSVAQFEYSYETPPSNIRQVTYGSRQQESRPERSQRNEAESKVLSRRSVKELQKEIDRLRYVSNRGRAEQDASLHTGQVQKSSSQSSFSFRPAATLGSSRTMPVSMPLSQQSHKNVNFTEHLDHSHKSIPSESNVHKRSETEVLPSLRSTSNTASESSAMSGASTVAVSGLTSLRTGFRRMRSLEKWGGKVWFTDSGNKQSSNNSNSSSRDQRQQQHESQNPIKTSSDTREEKSSKPGTATGRTRALSSDRERDERYAKHLTQRHIGQDHGGSNFVQNWI
jgi:hypothetical protein